MANSLKKIIPLFMGLCLALSVSADPEIVLLNFYADGECVRANYEATSGTTYNLSSIVSNPSDCRGYEFVGWKQDSPANPGETPATVSSVTPTKNMNFYAVYRRTGGVTNRYVRITSVKDLHAGSQYLLVCYYDHDGDIYYGPSYFAMKNIESNSIDVAYYKTGSTYYNYDVYAKRYSIMAEQIFPDGGVCDDPVSSIIWTLDGSEDAWTLTNGSQSLKVCDGYSNAFYKSGSYYNPLGNYNHHILANPGNTFAITSSNGSFNFKADGYYLTYSDDEEDYFKMGSSNAWDFYLFKKEDLYTSYPDCSDWRVNFDALAGTVGTTGQHTSYLPESGSGVTLPTAVKPASVECSDWEFAGWTPEAPLRGTTQRPKLYLAGSNYKPIYDGETLYAVYVKKETVPCYVRVSAASEISSGDTCVIATAVGDTAVTNTMTNSYYFISKKISIYDGKIAIADVSADIKWRCTISNSKRYFYYGSTYLSYNGSSYYYYVENSSSPFYMRENYSGYWYMYPQTVSENRVFGEKNISTGYSYYIYRKSTGLMPVSYTSYPHCSRFKVNLHGCGGTIGGEDGPLNTSDTETTIGGGITLPSIVVPSCDKTGVEWTFEGWQEGGDLELYEDVRYTGLLNGSYIPDRDEVDLYAVFKRKTNKYDIIYNPANMESGDEYIVTGYDYIYDWAITTDTHDANHLAGIKTASPKGIGGYYVIVDDLKAVWVMDGTYTSCTFQNVADPTKYLASNNSGHTMTSGSATSYKFAYSSDDSGFSFAMQETATNRYMIFNIIYNPTDTASYFSTGTSIGSYSMYVYRRIKEYSSWPHCNVFTVQLDKGTGTVEGNITSLRESDTDQGITLPNAYANADCAKEGWTFAGWAEMPVMVESDALTVNLLPAGTHYRIPADNKILYAVYYQRENTYQRVTTIDDLKTGVNYIITKNINSTSAKALGNTYKAGTTDYITAVDVSLSGNFITNTSAAIDWRLSLNQYNEFEWFNVSDSVYLDLRTKNKAKLTSKVVWDNFEIFYSGGFVIRSIQSLEHNIKYLGYDATNDRFKSTNLTADSALLYIYEQEAIYFSNPSCVQATDVVEWTKENGETYVYLESFVLGEEPTMPGGVGYPVRQDDGTWKFKYRMDHCTTTLVRWDGTRSTLRIPYIMDKPSTNASDSLIGDCTECDVVVLSGKTLTIDDDIEVHTLTLQEGATLNIGNKDKDVTLTVNSLVLSAKGDAVTPMVNIAEGSSIVLNHKELYYDLRIPNDRYYWMALPFEAHLTEISYSNEEANDGIPAYNTDFYVYFYNGKLRSDDANGGAQDDTYWNQVSTGADYTMRPGQGYLLGVDDGAVGKFNNQGYGHTKRVIRFTMRPPESTWLDDERETGYKIGPVSGATARIQRNAVHMGWNLIGNPYMHTYNMGSAISGLLNGEWEKEKIGDYETKYYVLKSGTTTVPYVTLYNTETDTYNQELANGRSLRPFEAVFVQVEQGTGIKFENGDMNVPASAPAYMRIQEQDAPVRTGIKLSGVGGSDKTGFVLHDDYTSHYEIGADLQKMNAGAFNLYSFNADNQVLAFNGLSEEDAADPIKLGVTFPVAGEYTFEFDNEQYSFNAIDTLMIIDKITGERQNLKWGNYTFTTESGAVNNRFEILIRLAKGVITDIEPTMEVNDQPRKVIMNGQLFILKDDEIYNAMGGRVR